MDSTNHSSEPLIQGSSAPLEATLVAQPGRMADFVALTKLRLNSLILLTTWVGFYLGTPGPMNFGLLFHTLFGTFMVAGGAAALNQVWERDNDARMRRTMNRPLPAGRLETWEGAVFGLTIAIVGTAWLGFFANALTAVLGLISFLTYVVVYTPMKVRSAWNTVVGAISGALPPVMGWTAVRGTLGPEAMVLFAILFLWQHPHFFALAWRYREDYRIGGFRMLSHSDPDGRRSGIVMMFTAALLLPVAALLSPLGVTGSIYLVCSFVLGMVYLLACIWFLAVRTDKVAMKAFLASLAYLTLLLTLMFVDKQA